MKKIALWFLFILSALILNSEEISVNTIPNPRLNGGWVTQIGSYLSDEDISKINQILESVENETTAEIALVILPSTGGDVFTFSQDLFDLWKIGKKDKNNGVLIVASMEEREFRTHTGYGIEPILTDAFIKILQEREVVPSFKQGKYGEGIIRYLEKIKSVLVNPETKEEIRSESLDYGSNNNFDVNEYRKNRERKDMPGVIIASLICLILAFYSIFIQNVKLKKDSKKEFNRYSEIKKLHERGFDNPGGVELLLVIAVIVINAIFLFKNYFFVNSTFFIFSAIGFVLFVITANKKSNIKNKIIREWRSKPRRCPECGGAMNKLSENEDDNYLSQTQVTEEKVKSYDYDVWLCDNCKNKTVEQFRDRNYNFYIVCPKCKGLTAKQKGSKVVSYPTYESTGQRKLTFICESCKYEFSKYVTIPRLQRTTTSYSSGSSGSFGGGGGGYSGGGGSFGGGSSGGGGSSSSW